MSKVFLRYFVSILLCAILVMVIQLGIIFVQYDVSQNRWKKQVYEDFVRSVEETIQNGKFSDFGLNGVMKAVSDIDDDRVSGFIIRDTAGNNMLSFGMTPDGRMLTSFLSGNQRIAENGVVKKVRNYKVLNLTSQGFGRGYTVKSMTSSGPLEESLPRSMKNEEIIGSIVIAIDGNELFVIDLMTYSPKTYEYSKDIINSCFKGALVSIPLCLIFAWVAAWIISSSNAAYINEVRKALNDLSRGKPNVKIPKQSNSELNEITLAIEELDKNLQSNAKSRKAWLSSISHDLNTPAASMKMIIDGMNDGVFPVDEETLKNLQKENDTLTERIGKVIDFSSLQADTVAVLDVVPAQQFADDILLGFETPVSLAVQCDAIRCDAPLMRRAVTELLKNAFEASGEAGSVSWTIAESDDSYTMEIVNEGHVPSDMGADFFEPWTRGDWSRTNGGSGLGLPIAVTILYLHSGTIELKQLDESHVQAQVRWPK